MSDYDEWKNVHQPFELKYHQQGNFRWPGREEIWDEQWNNIFNLFAKLDKDTFTEQDVLVDIGCGSRPALQWFNNGDIYNIDPLLYDYLKIKTLSKHWDQYRSSQLISDPAEEFQAHLENKADFILSWNVLDHCYNPEKIIENCYKYCKQNGLFLLGVDLGGKPHVGHPGIQDAVKFRDLIYSYFEVKEYSRAGFKRSRTDSFLLKKK